MSAVFVGLISAEIGIEVQCRAAPADGEICDIQHRGGQRAGLGRAGGKHADNVILVASANVFNFIIFLQYKNICIVLLRLTPPYSFLLSGVGILSILYFFSYSFPVFVAQAHNIPCYISNCLLLIFYFQNNNFPFGTQQSVKKIDTPNLLYRYRHQLGHAAPEYPF